MSSSIGLTRSNDPNLPQPIYVIVTPDDAKALLDYNQVNRNLRGGMVEKYARDMKENAWGFSESAVCFDKEGTLLNGQHRLHAIIKSGTTVTMLFLMNMDKSQMATMDIGAARSAKDVFGFDGEKHASALAAAVRVALSLSQGDYYCKNALSVSELRKFLTENPEIRDSVEEGQKWFRALDTTATALTIAHWMIRRSGAPKQTADLYLEKLGTRVGEPLNSPILAVDSRLREVRRLKTPLPVRFHVFLLLRGWNYWASGKLAHRLSAQPKGDVDFRLPNIAKYNRKEVTSPIGEVLPNVTFTNPSMFEDDDV